MYNEEYQAMAKGSLAKWRLLRDKPGAYFVAAMLAGIFVGLGVALAYTVGGYAAGTTYQKLLSGVSFSAALSLVIMAGAELFTGGNMVMTAGVLRKEVTIGQLAKVWVVCYLGNWVGSILLAYALTGTGIVSGATGQFMADTAATKMTLDPEALFLRGILCNFLVCLAVWCGYRCKNEVAKLIMIMWCILIFFTCGFEHSIANMTLLTIGLINPLNEAISLGGYFYNLSIVTLGNILGGALFVAVPYHLISRPKKCTL